MMGYPDPEPDFDGEIDIPWADPSIRRDYEAALGRLILAFNSVDLYVTRLLECYLRKMGDPPILRKLATGNFAQRIENLAMLEAMPMKLTLKGTNFDRLKELNRLRNIVAHGHFEQNPFMGDYRLITNKKRHDEFSTERLDKITSELEREAAALSATTDFYDVLIENIDRGPPREENRV